MTPLQNDALKNHILADPALAALAGAAGATGNYPYSQDESIAQAINARAVPSSKKIPVQDAYLYLLKRLKWRGIEAAANDPQHLATDAAYTAVKLVSAPNMLIDFTDPVSGALMDVLVAAGLLTVQNKADLVAMCTTAISEGEALFGQRIGNLDVARALGRNGFGG